MFTNFTRRITKVLVFTILVYTMNPISIALATSSHVQQIEGSGPQVIPASAFDESRPLSSITPIPPPNALIKLRNRLLVPKTLSGASDDVTDISIVQSNSLSKSTSNAMAAPVTSFDGVGHNGSWPSDANGDIGYSSVTGIKYYMQAVNTSFQIWDVTDPTAVATLFGPASGNTLWSGFGGICETHNDGDPIIQFDHLANRWMFSQFAFNDPNNYHQCIAVSTSADPTSTWYRYDFQYSTTKLNDYTKFGVWPDGYYMSVNQFDGSTQAWSGAGAVVFNRTAMLSGLPAAMIKFDIGAVYLGYGLMLPSDLDGPAPAAGTPNNFIEWDDSAWQGDATDTLRVWNFHVDWATPSNSTFGANASFDPNAMVATANLDSDMCGFSATSCIPQPGTSQKLDVLTQGQLMYRLQYRNFGSYQTLVGNQTVDANGADKTGVYWFELRNSGAGWGMNQQGVYAPDADNRWMGSAAMDGFGNLALGYSVSSASTYPSVRYAGRLVSDPLGTLPQSEASLAAGGGSQTGVNRWGDYSMMTVDPTDDCTFWYTQEYYSFTSSSSWKTRIGSFAFPSCTRAITGNAGAAGVTLSYTDGTAKTATSLGNGSYSLPVSSGWSGTVTPSHTCFTFSPTSRSYSNVTTNKTAQNYTATFNVASGCANINVSIAGANQGKFGILPGTGTRASFPGVDNGPVKVISANLPIVAGLRELWTQGGTTSSFQLMGLPDSQLSDTYWFPSYNNVTLNEQVRFGNVGASNTTVTVTIGGIVKGTYPLTPNQQVRVNYAGLDSGPVKVQSSGGIKIIAAIRDAWFAGTAVESFSQLMGLPSSQLSDTYWFPSYNNVTLNEQLRFGNVDIVDTNVTVTIGATSFGPYLLHPNEQFRINYPGVDSGPVKVQGTSGVKIIAALREAWFQGSSVESWIQLMGLPAPQLSDTYYFPAYDNVSLNGQLRFGNVGVADTNVTVTIGVTSYGPYLLHPSEQLRVNYPSVNSGPVKVQSSGGVKIIAALRDALVVNGVVESFAQMMGLPGTPSTTYWFPSYNNVTLDEQLRIGAP